MFDLLVSVSFFPPPLNLDIRCDSGFHICFVHFYICNLVLNGGIFIYLLLLFFFLG